MIQPRLNINFGIKRQFSFVFGKEYTPQKNEFLLNFARSGIVMALRATLPNGSRVGVVAYNCYTVANAVKQAGCDIEFIDITEDLQIDISSLQGKQLDAIVVTNLFGIRNDITAIRVALPDTIIIVDNAHGYGLPCEGDFTVYSINQGKFPSVGEGGVLFVNNQQYQSEIQKQYERLPQYSRSKELKLFCTMTIKAWLHTPIVYTILTKRLKSRRKVGNIREVTPLQKMAYGVRRMYNAILPCVEKQITQQCVQAEAIRKALSIIEGVTDIHIGGNAFMVVVRCTEPRVIQQWFAQRGVETATHFENTILWEKQFDYEDGTCPMAEKLTKELLMIPTYKHFTL